MSLTLGHTGARREGLLLDADTAVRQIKSGSTVAVGGSGSLLQVPETLLPRSNAAGSERAGGAPSST